jgi:hypothetical protein
MAYNHFRPKPGRFGTHPQLLTVQPTPTITAGTPATTTFRIPSPYRRCMFVRGSVSVTTVPADSDGTLLATFQKYDASADAAVSLTSTLDLEALVTREVSKLDPVSTATNAQLTLDDGDCFELSVASTSAAINTQPTDLSICVEVLVLE